MANVGRPNSARRSRVNWVRITSLSRIRVTAGTFRSPSRSQFSRCARRPVRPTPLVLRPRAVPVTHWAVFGGPDETNLSQRASVTRPPVLQMWQRNVLGRLYSTSLEKCRSAPAVPELQVKNHDEGKDDRRRMNDASVDAVAASIPDFGGSHCGDSLVPPWA